MAMKIGYIMEYDLKLNPHLTEWRIINERRMDLSKVW